tara:strand:- start:331 stop:549 length:219 start_codon:yes stop_codon:yes gene_type:complete
MNFVVEFFGELRDFCIKISINAEKVLTLGNSNSYFVASLLGLHCGFSSLNITDLQPHQSEANNRIGLNYAMS